MTEAPTCYDDLRALFINGALKRSPERSHTQGLIDVSAAIMRKHGVAVDVLRAIDDAGCRFDFDNPDHR